MTLTDWQKKVTFIILSVIVSLALAVFLAEICLEITDRHEKNALLDYPDTIDGRSLSWGGFLKKNFNAYVTDGLGGRAHWVTDAEGFRSTNSFSREPAPGVLRILALGDSFNVGYRVDQKFYFNHWRQQWLKRKYGQAEILVAETEEPATALYYLVKFGLRLQPQIVTLGLTLGNDIAEAYVGMGRRYLITATNGQVHIAINSKPLPGLNLAAYQIPPAYLKSENPFQRFTRRTGRWLTRTPLLRPFYQQHEAVTSWGDRDQLNLFDFNNGFGMFAQPTPPAVEKAYQRLFHILKAMSLLCRQHGIIFAVQIFPQRYQVQPEDWLRAVQEYGLKASRFNLMGPNQKIVAFCRQQNIICLDATAALARWYARRHQPLYLPRGDMHWNQNGHWAFFKCSLPAFAKLAEQGYLKVQANTSGQTVRINTPRPGEPAKSTVLIESYVKKD
ncbi:MAG: hypothetical protein P8X58_13600 [Syntrophobacterales bacterium]